MLRRFFIIVPSLLIFCGFTCSPGKQKNSETKEISSSPPVATSQPNQSVSGILRLRILVGSGVALVDKMGGTTGSVRMWDWEHEKEPQPSREIKLEDILNAENSVGDYMNQPELYVEIANANCSPEEDKGFACSQIALKTNAEFDEKVHKDKEFREKLGRLIGSSVTVNRSNPVFNVTDVK